MFTIVGLSVEVYFKLNKHFYNFHNIYCAWPDLSYISLIENLKPTTACWLGRGQVLKEWRVT